MTSSYRCVAGQLGWRIAERYELPTWEQVGFVSIPGGGVLGGYDLLVTCGLHPSWSVAQLEGTRELLRCAGRVLGGDGTIPRGLSSAFSSFVPAVNWIREIGVRRSSDENAGGGVPNLGRTPVAASA